MAPDDPRHGTIAGYSAHRVAGVPHCGPCIAASTEYQRKLEIDHILGRPRRVDATGTIRRLQALAAIGWSTVDLAEYLDRSPCDLRKTRTGYWPTVRRGTAQAVAALYEQLCMTPGPSKVARAAAARGGWLPPLAWDDIDTDEQASDALTCADKSVEEPDVDPVVVERVLAGDRLPANRAERHEVIRRWVDAGRSVTALEELTGWNVRRYRQEAAA